MRILITNDDGIHAPGLTVLEALAREFSDDIWVCAPSEEQSGAGHSLTLNRPLRCQQFGDQRFAVTGTPTDSVMMALREVLDSPPDLILSGVNRGANVGDDITYSGTAAAAMEGALAGIRSISLSQVYNAETRDTAHEFAAAQGWGAQVIARLLETPSEPHRFVNVNFPPRPAEAVQGMRVVRHGFHDYSRGSLIKNTDPRGHDYYWLGLNHTDHQPAQDTDLAAIRDGYISITPVQLDLTDYAGLDRLAEQFAP